jgi:hypothetical protein
MVHRLKAYSTHVVHNNIFFFINLKLHVWFTYSLTVTHCALSRSFSQKASFVFSFLRSTKSKFIPCLHFAVRGVKIKREENKICGAQIRAVQYRIAQP